MLNMTSYTANANLLLVSIKGLRPFHVMGEEKTQRFFPRHPRPYFHTLPSEGTCKPNFGRRTCHRFVQQTAKIYSQLPKAMGTPPLPESTRGPSCSTRWHREYVGHGAEDCLHGRLSRQERRLFLPGWQASHRKIGQVPLCFHFQWVLPWSCRVLATTWWESESQSPSNAWQRRSPEYHFGPLSLASRR